MSAPDDSYRTAPTWELIDNLLDNRPEVYKRAKTELLVRLKKHEKRKAHRIGRDGSGKQIKAAAVCNLGLEGIVSKRLSSMYKSGPSKAWIKVKNPKSPARVIDGFEKKSFRHEA